MHSCRSLIRTDTLPPSLHNIHMHVHTYICTHIEQFSRIAQRIDPLCVLVEEEGQGEGCLARRVILVA